MFDRINRLVGELPLARKLGLMALLLIAPVLVLGAMFITAQNVRVESTARQLDGLRFLRPLVQLQAQLANHRSAALMALSGEGGSGPIREAQASVDAALKSVVNAQAETGDQFGTQTLVNEVSETWTTNLKPNWNTGNTALSFDMHTLLLAQVADVIRLVGQNAGTEFATVDKAGHVDRALALTLPANTESLSQLGAFGLVCAKAGTPSQEQWDQLIVLTQEARRGVDGLRAELVRVNKRAGFDASIKGAASQAIDIADAYLEAAQEGASRRDVFRTDLSLFRAQADQATSAFGTLHVRLVEKLESELADSLGSLRFARNMELFGVFALLGLALGLGYLIASTTTRQVQSIGSVFERLREGDLNARAEVVARDEFGSFAISLNRVLDNSVALIQSREERDRIQGSIQKLLQEMEGVAQGDLTQEAEAGEEPTGAIANSFNLMLVELRGLINRVQESSSAVNAAAAIAEEATVRLADGSQTQAQQIVQASAAAEQMAQSIQQVTGQAAAAARIAQEALRNAQLGTRSAEQTIDGMGEVKRQVNAMGALVHELSASSVQIGDITQLIADISKRTSILALNASIQAAVAGDSGKGFGVVAEQVEELAARSSDAVRRVATLTKSVQVATSGVIEALNGATQQVASGEQLASEASARLSQIESVSGQLAGVVDSILIACRQQSASSESIASSMGEISRVTKHTSSGAQAATSSIHQLAGLAEQLRGSVARFRLPARSNG